MKRTTGANTLESAAFYAKLLGKDGDYFTAVGNAHAGLGEMAKALEAYRSGLADDPQAGDNVLGLMKTLSAEHRNVVIEHYKALNDNDEWFVSFSDTLLGKGDADTLRVLIDIHRTVMPDDENLPVCEKALAELLQTN